MEKFEVCIIGAGVAGLAVAYQLSSSSLIKGPIVLLERESGFGQHCSSRNSEVIHAGIYYPQGSLKAESCVRGKQLLYAFCREHDIQHHQIGKYIVAPKQRVDELAALKERGQANGVEDLQLLGRTALAKVEAAVAGDGALYSPSTGIVDSHGFMQCLLHEAEDKGVLFSAYTEVTQICRTGDSIQIECQVTAPGQDEKFQIRAERVVNCAGLSAQQIAARCSGFHHAPIPPLYPCKGDYFSYSGPSPFKHLIYPLPEPGGLGIHATLDIAGQLRFGPDVEYVERFNYDVDGAKTDRFAAAISRYFPQLEAHRLQADYAGIRPKLAAPGEPPGDFVIQEGDLSQRGSLIHLFGIESPGLTAALDLGNQVLGRVTA